jgi:hypothetical protein
VNALLRMDETRTGLGAAFRANAPPPVVLLLPQNSLNNLIFGIAWPGSMTPAPKRGIAVTIAATHRQACARASQLFGALATDQLHLLVPATPAWAVHEVLAQLVGGAADAFGDRLDGAASATWTQRHVEERRTRTVGELLDEWDEVSPASDALTDRIGLFGPRLDDQPVPTA